MRPSRQKRTTVWLLLAAMLSQGCAGPAARIQYLTGNDKSLSHYEDMATAIEYPIEDDPQQVDQGLFVAPRSINDLSDIPRRSMTLRECVRLALAKSAVLRDDASFGSPGNPLMANPGRVASVYDSAIQETNFLLGNRGPEAALSDFDALFTNNLQWGRSEDPQNAPFLNLTPGATLTEESAQWSSRIEKPFANSGTFSVQHDWNYSGNNVPSRLFPSAYTGFLQGEYRQPLLAGSGTEFTRIAGPLTQNLRGVSGVSQGVLISRINSDISLIDFEQSVSTIVRDVENRYWDLYLSLQLYDSEIHTFRDLVRFWKLLTDRESPGEATAQAQARIFEADARMKGSLADVLDAEARLRRLLGLPLNDGEFLVPADEPSEAKVRLNWESTLTEALAHRAELRRQKWEIRSLELQLQASKNLSRPRLDFVSQYRVNGFGDSLTGEEDDDGATDVGYGSAYESLTQGHNTTWNLGFSFAMPLGLRLARAAVRNFELRLVKSRAVLAEQEREIAYELHGAMLNMDRWYALAESSTKRLSSATSSLEATESRTQGLNFREPTQLGRVLDAQITRRDAEQAYLRSIVEYNKSINDLNFRKGMSLVNQSIYLAEGEWNPGAYEDARRRAISATHAKENPHLKSEPAEFAGGPAPSAWESLGRPDRPHISAGRAGNAAVEQSPGNVPPVPDRSGNSGRAAVDLDDPPAPEDSDPAPADAPAPDASDDAPVILIPPQQPLPVPVPEGQNPQLRPVPTDGRVTGRPPAASGWKSPSVSTRAVGARAVSRSATSGGATANPAADAGPGPVPPVPR